jgi:hypothetical protein
MPGPRKTKKTDKPGRPQALGPASVGKLKSRAPRAILQILGALVGILVVSLGVWIYYPRTSLYENDGLAVETDCSLPPKVSFSVEVWDAYVYDIILLLEDISKLNCHKLRLVTSSELTDLKFISFEYTRKRFPLESIKLVKTDLDQPVIDIDVSRLAELPTQIVLTIRDVRQDGFEKFRVTIPNAKIGIDDKLVRTPLHLWVLSLQSGYEFTNVSPEPKTKNRQAGFEIVAFPQEPLTELDAQFVSPLRDQVKNIYNAVVLAIAGSLIASWVYAKFNKAP